MNKKIKIHLVYTRGVNLPPEFFDDIARLRAEIEALENVRIVDKVGYQNKSMPDRCIALLDYLEKDVERFVERTVVSYSERNCAVWGFVLRGTSRLPGDSPIACAINTHNRVFQKEAVQRVYPYDTCDDIRRMVVMWLEG